MQIICFQEWIRHVRNDLLSIMSRCLVCVSTYKRDGNAVHRISYDNILISFTIRENIPELISFISSLDSTMKIDHTNWMNRNRIMQRCLLVDNRLRDSELWKLWISRKGVSGNSYIHTNFWLEANSL